MTITPVQTEKLLTGNYKFSLLSFSMLVTRLKMRYEKDSSPERLQSCANEINTFLQKYGDKMKNDCSIISNL